MATDGSLNFNTKIDESGFNKGIRDLTSGSTGSVGKSKKAGQKIGNSIKSGIEKAEPVFNAVKQGLQQIGSGLLSLAKNIGSKIGNRLGIGVKSQSPFASIKASLTKLAGVAATAFGVSRVIEFGKYAVNTASDLTEAQNVVDTAFGSMSGNMEAFADTAVETYGISKLSAKKTGSTFMAMAAGMGIAQNAASEMSLSLTGLSADMASFYNVSQDVASTALKSIFTGETETLKQFGIVMTEDNLSAYALAQGITTSYSAMSQAEKVQLRYQYVMAQTSLAQGDFAKTSGSWANQTRMLSEKWKEFASVIGTVLVNVMLPAVKAINAALSAMIEYATNAANALASVFGWTIQSSSGAGALATETADLMDNTSDVSDNIADSATNQDALTNAVIDTTKAENKQLATFDKLNVMSKGAAENSSTSAASGTPAITTGTSSGSTSNSVGPLNAGEAAKNQLSSLANQIKKLWENQDYSGFGEMLANKINKSLANINWSKIQSTTKQWAENIANFLNGAVKELDWKLVGSTVGNGVNTALGFAYKFLKTFNYQQWGKELANGLNGFISSVKWALIGKTFGAYIQSSIATGFGFVTTFKWAQAGLSISSMVNNFFAEIDWLQAAQTFSGGIIGALSTVNTALATVDWASIGTDIATFLSNVNWWGILTGLATAVWSAFTGVFEALVAAWETNPLAGWIMTVVVALGVLAVAIGIVDAVMAVLPITWIILAVAALVAAIIALVQNWDVVCQAVGDGWNWLMDLFSGWGEWIYYNVIKPIGDSFTGLWQGICDTFSGIGKWFGDIFSGAWKAICNAFNGVGKFFQGIWTSMCNAFNGTVSWFKTLFENVWNCIKGIINNFFIANIESFVNYIISGFNMLISGADWVVSSIGSLFGQDWGIDQIAEISIPRLATGTVVPANYGNFLATLGDNKREPEIVSPLSTMKQALREVMQESGVANGSGEVTIICTLDGSVVFKKVIDKNEQYKKQHSGRSAFA